MPSIKAHAKINIGLRILGRRRSDGYHLIETIFQELDFADTIIIDINTSGFFTLTCNREDISVTEDNLILKAINALKPSLPKMLGAEIHLEKNIPPGSGLGGGSSDAAAILKFFSAYCQIPVDLKTVATVLGADVSFFLRGGTAYATGIGEDLETITIPLNWTVVLVIPNFQISTQQAYCDLRIPLTDTIKKPKILSFLQGKFAWQFFENDFERVIIPAYPQIGKIKSALLKAGADFSALSGSGSTVYGIFSSNDAAKSCIPLVQEFGRVVICHPYPLANNSGVV
ncbi:MAG: 4-(cytidine 5'-diphospho)-2-C-methyl-D-erythritol kinase [Candidatus Marinimicrobia bacterium]|nr:4-(cytidine 5'-diphospho)-2-C-methyl-D-erythritol kinase [Candidatus Neomarinimicrobiota bacterium]